MAAEEIPQSLLQEKNGQCPFQQKWGKPSRAARQRHQSYTWFKKNTCIHHCGIWRLVFAVSTGTGPDCGTTQETGKTYRSGQRQRLYRGLRSYRHIRVYPTLISIASKIEQL
jgi:hypothetical protein